MRLEIKCMYAKFLIWSKTGLRTGSFHSTSKINLDNRTIVHFSRLLMESKNMLSKKKSAYPLLFELTTHSFFNPAQSLISIKKLMIQMILLIIRGFICWQTQLSPRGSLLHILKGDKLFSRIKEQMKLGLNSDNIEVKEC